MRPIDADAMRQDWLENVWDIILRILGVVCVSLGLFWGVVICTSVVMLTGAFFAWVFGIV